MDDKLTEEQERALAICGWPSDNYFTFRDYLIIVPGSYMNKPLEFDTYRERKDKEGKIIRVDGVKVVYIDRRVMSHFEEEKLSKMIEHMIIAREAFIRIKKEDKLLIDEAVLAMAFDEAESSFPLPTEWGEKIKVLFSSGE